LVGCAGIAVTGTETLVAFVVLHFPSART
jgi:hypothetical protein